MRTPFARPLPHLLVVGVLILTGLLVLPVTRPAPAEAADLPAGFRDYSVLTNLNKPTAVEFAADGKVVIAEKSGTIKVFNDLKDSTPEATYSQLRTNVHNYWDRGLLGFKLHPSWPANPNIYALYAHDAAIGGTAPRWGTANAADDNCPAPPGGTDDGCVISGRLSKLTLSGANLTEQVLIEDWSSSTRATPSAAWRSGPTVSCTSPAVTGPASTGPTTVRTAARSTRAATRPARRGPCSPRPPPRAARCARRTCAPPATRPPWTARSCG